MGLNRRKVYKYLVDFMGATVHALPRRRLQCTFSAHYTLDIGK